MPDGLTPQMQEDMVLCARNAIVQQDDAKGIDGFSYLYGAGTPTHFEIIGPILEGRKQLMQGGSAMDWFTVYKDGGSFQFVLPGQTYQPGIVNVMAKGTAPWRHAHWDYSILRNEMMSNRTPEKLCNFLRARKTAEYMGAAVGMESEFFASPVHGSATQPLTFGYWVVPILGIQAGDSGSVDGININGAFQGGLPNNGDAFTDVGGIDPGGEYTDGEGFATETYARHRNWNFDWSNSSGQYTDVDEDNLGNAYDSIDFKPPKFVTGLDELPHKMKRVYVCQVLKNSMERAAKNQNDNIGPDLARYQNATMFRGLPLTWLKLLDTANTTYRGTNPIMGVNWAHGHIVVREGEDFLEQTFGPDKYLPDMTTTEVDFTYQFVVSNRQQFAFIGSYVAAE